MSEVHDESTSAKLAVHPHLGGNEVRDYLYIFLTAIAKRKKIYETGVSEKDAIKLLTAALNGLANFKASDIKTLVQQIQLNSTSFDNAASALMLLPPTGTWPVNDEHPTTQELDSALIPKNP